MASDDAQMMDDAPSGVSFSTFVDTTDEAKAEFDRRRAIAEKYGDLFKQMMMLESQYYAIDSESENARLINEQYEKLADEYSALGDQLYSNEYDRFLKGTDYYYESSHYDLSLFDVTRAFDPIRSTSDDMKMDVEERRTQESLQMERMQAMIDRGGPLLDLSGEIGTINRLILKKVKTFGHPVQTVQLNESDKMILEQDFENLERLKRDGLISYLVYKELKGDVMLF